MTRNLIGAFAYSKPRSRVVTRLGLHLPTGKRVPTKKGPETCFRPSIVVENTPISTVLSTNHFGG